MTAPLEALPLVRNITRHAYRAGASLVTTLFSDEESTLMRFREAPDASFDKATGWLFDGMANAFRAGAARLAIVGENPALLAKEDPQKVARANRARSQAYQPALELIAGFDINWTIASFATPAWAKAVFPGDPGGACRRRALARHLRRLAHRYRRPGGRLAGAQSQPQGALRPPQPEELRRAAFPRAGHRSHRRPCRRSRLGGRRHDRQERHRLQPQHPLRGSLHHAAQGPGRGPCHQHQAALLSGHADRGDRRPLRERARSSRRGRRPAARSSTRCSKPTQAPAASAKSRWCRTPRRSRRAASSFSTRSSTRTPPATSPSARPTRNASRTATS